MPNNRVVVGKVFLGLKIRRTLWNMVYSVLFRPFPTKVFWPWRWIILKIFGAKVSFHAHVYSSVKIWAPWNLKMDPGTCLGPHVICYNQAMVELEEGSTVSQYAYLCTAGHKTDEKYSSQSGLEVSKITLKKNAWIGTSAFINMGVIVGENAIVGATASVYKDVDPRIIVGGNPAKEIKKRQI